MPREEPCTSDSGASPYLQSHWASILHAGSSRSTSASLETASSKTLSISPKNLQSRTDRSSPSRCRVSICCREGCKLLSHRYYSKSRAPLSRSRSLSSLSSLAHYLTSDTNLQRSLSNPKPVRFRILLDRIENLPALPIQDEAFLQADILLEITNLFHRFFCRHFDEMTAILRSPSSISYALKQAALSLALKEPLYCITVITLSQFIETRNRSSDEILEDQLTYSLYTRLLQYCHESLEDADMFYVDLIVLAIVVLCLFDLSTERYSSVLIHRRGLVALLSKIGGHYNLKLSLHYITWIDRTISVMLLEEPLFPSPVGSLTMSIDELHGYEFDKIRLKPAINSEITAICKDTARLMDLFGARKAFYDPIQLPKPNAKSQVLSADEICFFRDIVDFRLASLLSRRDDFNLLESCILLATKIVESTVAFPNFLPALDLRLSVCIRERLSAAPNGGNGIDLNGKITWGRLNDLLLWILFASAIPCTVSGEHQDWIVKMISKVAASLFEKRIIWQNAFKQSERKSNTTRTCSSADVWVILSKFVWSPILQSRFREVCSQIPQQ